MSADISFVHFSIAMPFYRGRTRWFMASARRNGLDTRLIKSWFRSIVLVEKIKYQYSFVSNLKDEGIVMFTDAYDVLVVQHKDRILENFLRTDAPILFSAEKSCWPDSSKANLYPPCDSPWRYLNSGGWIGNTGKIKEILRMANDIVNRRKDIKRDQMIYTDIYLNNQSKIRLDTACDIFQTLWQSLQDMSFENGEWVNRRTGTRPCILHSNSKRENIDPFAKVIGYS